MSTRMRRIAWTNCVDRAFTLVELLVVVSIIALLISILLPSLKTARDSAKAAVCGSNLKGFGTGLQTYATEENDWIPGRNTSGVAMSFAMYGSNPADAVQQPNLPVQTYDWMTPLLRTSSGMPNNRAKKFRLLRDHYRCAAVNFKAGRYGSASPPDEAVFEEDENTGGKQYGGSYLMPVYFQMFGTDDSKNFGMSGFGIPIKSLTPYDTWSVEMKRYRSQINRVGTPADKIAFADGTRYLDQDGILSFNHELNPRYFGAFTTSGAWWRGSTAYGDGGDSGSVGGSSAPKGRQLPLTYRHNDKIEAAFFDGHVENLSRKQSHKIDYWYPKGGVIRPGAAAEGFTDFAQYEDGYIIR